MKVYIAYDDVIHIGVYASWLSARHALRDAADAYCATYGLRGPCSRSRWRVEGSITSCHIECDGNEWDQWYEVHEVQP